MPETMRRLSQDQSQKQSQSPLHTRSPSRPTRAFRPLPAFLAALVAATVAACATPPPAASTSPGGGATTSLNESRPTGPSRWELVRWQQPDGTERLLPAASGGQPLVFEFSDGIDAAQGAVTGYAGCNRFTGGYGKTSSGMAFQRVASTRMACQGPGMATEDALLKAMQSPLTTVGTQPSAAQGGRQIVWKTADGDLLQFVERGGVGKRGERVDAPAPGADKTIYLDAHRLPCPGGGTQTCYRYRDTPEGPWQLWYGPIEGLDFEEGTAYRLRVRETRIPNPASDQATVRWQLLGIEARTPPGSR